MDFRNERNWNTLYLMKWKTINYTIDFCHYNNRAGLEIKDSIVTFFRTKDILLTSQ